MAKKSESHKKEKVESEFEEKVLYINRCSKVVKGGRKFSFSALIAVGDGKKRVGFGFAKANELTDAIRRGGEQARQNMIECPMEGTTIPHEVRVKWDGASVMLKPAPKGAGIIAGSKIRILLELGGYRDVVAKSLGSNNPVNIVHATFKALTDLTIRSELIKRRGLPT